MKTKETNPTGPGSPTPCKQALNAKENNWTKRKTHFLTPEICDCYSVLLRGNFTAINTHREPPLPNAPRLGWIMGRGEPGGGKEREIRRKKCAITAGRRVGRETTCLVSVLTKRGINSIKKGQFILNSQIYAQRVPTPIHRCTGPTGTGRAFVRDGR